MDPVLTRGGSLALAVSVVIALKKHCQASAFEPQKAKTEAVGHSLAPPSFNLSLTSHHYRDHCCALKHNVSQALRGNSHYKGTGVQLMI